MRLLVCDNSQYVEFARCLGRSGLFDNVGYFCPWQDDTPTAQEVAVGAGFPEITREYDLWKVLDDYDAFAFPTLYWDGMQQYLRAQGRPVWGCGQSEYLERDRWALIQAQRSLGMPVAASRLVTLEQAKAVVQSGDVIKISTLRGDTETIKHDGDWSWWYELNVSWGPMRDSIKVVWQKPYPGKHCEPGFDFLVANGAFCEPFSVGYEVKDGGYLEKNILIADMPEPLQEVYEGVRELVKPDRTYSNFLSTEVLDGHLLDITTRIPQPPGDLKLFIWEGLPAIVSETLAYGRPVGGTEPKHTWGVQIIAHNNNSRSYCKWGEIDASIADHVFFNRAVSIEGQIWTVPWRDRSVQDWVDSASVCGSGDSPESAIDDAQRVIDELSIPHHCLIDPSTKDHLLEALEEGYKEGINL